MCTTGGAGPTATDAIGWAGMGLQLAGLGLGSKAAYDSSKATRDAYRHQAAVTQHSAELDEFRARDAIYRGQDAVNAHQLKVGAMRGKQRASFAARGLDINEGSALNILLDTEYLGNLDAATISDNAAREAWLLRESAATGRRNAAFYAARADAESPLKAGVSTLLAGAGQVASSWYRLNTKTSGY